MEKMLNEYLQFTSSSYMEKDEMFNLSELIEELLSSIIIKIFKKIYYQEFTSMVEKT